MSKRDPDRPNWGDPSTFEMFSQHRLDLAAEVKKHPTLIEYMQKHPQDEFEILLAEIASYCEVILNDSYTPSDLDNLCKILHQKLVVKRTGIVFARDPDGHYSGKGGW